MESLLDIFSPLVRGSSILGSPRTAIDLRNIVVALVISFSLTQTNKIDIQ